MSLRSKCDRAVAAYLRSVGVGNVFTGNDSRERSVPCVTVLCHSGRAEMPLTGIYRFAVRVRVQGHATLQPDEVDPNAQRMALDAQVELVHDSMMRVEDGDDLQYTADAITTEGRALAVTAPDSDADMAQFTCQSLYDVGMDGGNPSTAGGVDGAFWVEDLLFEIVCCGTNTD